MGWGDKGDSITVAFNGQAKTTVIGDDGKWNGYTAFVKDALKIPRKWRKPKDIFGMSMGDLFHEDVPFEYISVVFGIMAACPQHQFQLLTKRPARMLDWFSQEDVAERVDLFKHIALADRIDEFFLPEREVPISIRARYDKGLSVQQIANNADFYGRISDTQIANIVKNRQWRGGYEHE